MIRIEEIPVEDIVEFWMLHLKYLIDDAIIDDEEDVAYFSGNEYRDIIKAHMTRETDKHHMVYFIDGNEKIGAAQYNTYQSEDGKCFILDFWVFPEFRGNGTGHKCFYALEVYTRADGAQYYEINSQKENSIRFWKSLGFVENGKDEYDIRELSSTAQALYEKGESLGKPMWLLYEMPYRGIYGSEAFNVRISWNLLTLFALALLLAGMMTMEQTSTGLQQLLHASPRGRNTMFCRKFILSGVVIILLWAVPTILEIRTLMAGIDPATLAAPVQSLSFLGEFPVPVSIRGFLIGIYLARLLALLACACAVLFLSILFHRMEAACLVVCAVLILPTVLWSYLKLAPFRFLSAARVTDMIGIITQQQGQVGDGLLDLIVFMLIGTVCMFQTARCWNRAYG